MKKSILSWLLFGLSLQSLMIQAQAASPAGLPSGGSVVAGQASIQQSGGSLTVSQASNRAIIDWSSFSVAAGKTTQFNNGSGFTNLSDGSGIAGSATSSLTVNDVTLWDAGQYAVVISNASGMVTSESASLEIITNQAPTIATAPTNLWVLPGAPAAFAVTAVGDDPVSYCWLFNGTNLSNGGAIAGARAHTGQP